MMKRLIILDRDGVINQDSPNYIKSPEEFVFLPGSVHAMVRLYEAGYVLAIATNQSGIARGYYHEQTLEAIHQKLLTTVRAAGGDIACIKHCPHLPEAGCACRKPMPGMLHAIAKTLNCRLEGALMVGDRISDILVAKSVGVRPMVVLSSMTDMARLREFPDVSQFTSLAALVDALLSDVCHAISTRN